MEGSTCMSLSELPDGILLDIFYYLEIEDLAHVAVVCKAWNRVAQDNFLWRDVFYRDWQIKKKIEISEGRRSWKSEYKRLKYHTPAKLSQLITDNVDEIFHVSFSNNGLLFAAGCKDGTLQVWTSSHPCKLQFQFHLHLTEVLYSKFNSSDSLLLVVGGQSGSVEMAIFSLQGTFDLKYRIHLESSMFGAWFDDRHVLTMESDWDTEITTVWAAEIIKKTKPSAQPCYTKFLNFTEKEVENMKNLMVADCYPNDVIHLLEKKKSALKHLNECSLCRHKEYKIARSSLKGRTIALERVFKSFPPDSASESRTDSDDDEEDDDSDGDDDEGEDESKLGEENKDERKLGEKNKDENKNNVNTAEAPSVDAPDLKDKISNQSKCTLQQQTACQDNVCEIGNSLQKWLKTDLETLNVTEKLLIFECSKRNVTPHVIGIKKLNADFMMNRKTDNSSVDTVDHMFDMNGHIIGMSFSPDQRFLYVNCRPWPEDTCIQDFNKQPVLTNVIHMHVIDLKNMVELETVFKSHVGYTPYNRTFLISLDVCEDYVASGSEDRFGYIWDRHYGVSFNKFPHDDIVNSVAFNPVDPEMLVTVGDDHHVKVWRSHNWFHQQQQQNSQEQQQVQFQENQQQEKQEELQEKEREQKQEIKEPKQQQGQAPLDHIRSFCGKDHIQ